MEDKENKPKKPVVVKEQAPSKLVLELDYAAVLEALKQTVLTPDSIDIKCAKVVLKVRGKDSKGEPAISLVRLAGKDKVEVKRL